MRVSFLLFVLGCSAVAGWSHASELPPTAARDPLRSAPALDPALILGLPLDRFDAHGRLIQRTEVGGAKTYYTYDERGRLVRTVFPDRTTEDIEYGTGPLADKVISKRDRKGVRHLYTYDDRGKLVWEQTVPPEAKPQRP